VCNRDRSKEQKMNTAVFDGVELRESASDRDLSDGSLNLSNETPAHELAADIVVVDQAEEALVMDSRANLRPAQIVEHRLVHSLKQPVVLVSQVRSSNPCGSRTHC
jgi:hypothetical protein